MKIKIVQVGRNKDKYMDQAVEEFMKRLRPFATIQLISIKESSASKAFTREQCMQQEAQEILKFLANETKFELPQTIVLDEKGEEYSSTEFAQLLKENKDFGKTVIFIMGGPYGLSTEVKKKATKLMSMSKMTFTHQMIRLFLFEQIYRGFCIIAGKQYHY